MGPHAVEESRQAVGPASHQGLRLAMVLCLWVLPRLSAQQRPLAPSPTSGTSDPVEVQMRNVNFRFARDISFEIRNLRGQLRSTKPGVPVTFDDPGSFMIEIASAEVAVTPQSLAALMNSYVFADTGGSIKNVSVSIHGDRLVERGIIHKGFDLPFEIESTLSASPDGSIRVHAEKIKSAHVSIKGLLHLFGDDLSKLLRDRASRGLRIVGDDMLLDPRTLTPSPHLAGRITRVSTVGGKVVQVFDSGRDRSPLNPPVRATAYIYQRGGVLRFGKLTMNDADLEIVGDHPGFFDFFQKNYAQQLVAGYSKTTVTSGLVAHMIDYSRVPTRANRGGGVRRDRPSNEGASAED